MSKDDAWVVLSVVVCITLGFALGWGLASIAAPKDKNVERVNDLSGCREIERTYALSNGTSTQWQPSPYTRLSEEHTAYADVKEEVTLHCSFYKLRAKIPQ